MIPLPWHATTQTLLEIGKPPLVLLVGEPGVGKTTFVRHEARRMTGHSAVVLNGSPEIELGHLFGRWTLVGTETKFVDGPLPLALRTNRWLAIEDFSQIPLETRAACLPLRDQSEITNPLTGEVLPVPPEFRLVATTNTESLSCRRNSGIAKVLYDGFLIVECGDLSDAQVMAMLESHFPNTTEALRRRVVEVWNEYRDFSDNGSSGKPHLSYRAAEHLLRLLEAGIEENTAIHVAIVNKFLPSDVELFRAAKMKSSLA